MPQESWLNREDHATSRPSSKIFTGCLLLLVLISKVFYRSTSVYMELPQTISLPNFRSMLDPSPTWPWYQQWTLSNWFSLRLTCRNLATEPFQWLDLPSGMSCCGGSDTILMSPHSSKHWRPISTIGNSSLYLIFWLKAHCYYYYYYYYR